MSSELFDLLESTGAFQNPLNSLSSGSTSLASGSKTGLDSINSTTNTQVRAALNAGGLTTDKITAGKGVMDTATGGVSTLVNYGDKTVSEAFSRVSTTTAYTNGLASVGRTPTTCDIINSGFAVIQQKGAEWLSAMESALGTVNGKIQDLADLVSQGIGAGVQAITALAAEVKAGIDSALIAVNKVISDITAGIAEELAGLEKMVNSCVNFCMANMLTDWMKDSCVAGAINKMATPALKALV